MKFLLPLAAACVLAGCASSPSRPANYGTRAAEMHVGAVSADGWRVVSVTPVGQAPENVYHTPVYPAVEPEYYVPPVTFSLGIMLGRGVYLSPRWRHHGRRR